MATCVTCKQSHFGMLDLKAGFCKACRELNETEAGQRKIRSAAIASDPEIARVLLTTESCPSLPISKRLGIVTAECAFGMNAFKDLFAGVRDVIGGRSEAVQKTLRDSREILLRELKSEAYELGADAVIAIEFNYVELSTAGSMVLMTAAGTAVVLADQ